MSDCIEWRKYRDRRTGYGITSIKGKQVKAHRAAWMAINGPIPEGLYVLHRCDNRACVNVDHLFLGTYSDNNRDCRDKGRNRYPDTKGILHGLSKIQEQTAVKIKMLRGVISEAKVAKAVGLSQSQVHDIMVGKAWKHVTAKTRYSI